jgi:hypothetical protein
MARHVGRSPRRFNVDRTPERQFGFAVEGF